MNSCDEKVLQASVSAGAESKKTVAYFEAVAQNWHTMYVRKDLWGEIHQQRLAKFLAWVDELRLTPGTHVLDVGCGAGPATVALAQRGHFVEAIDVAAPMIELALQNAAAAGLANHVHATTGNIYDLDFPDSKFSLILSIGVVPWLQFPGQAISELARVLKPGGYLLFTADNSMRLARWIEPMTSPALGPIRRMLKKTISFPGESATFSSGAVSYQHSIEEVDAFLRDCGLQRLRLETLGFGPFTLFHRKVFPEGLGVKVNRALQRLADWRFPLFRSTGAQFLLVARKPS